MLVYARKNAVRDSGQPTLAGPLGHTVAVVVLFVALAIAGGLFQKHARSEPAALGGHPSVVPLYLSLIASEWALVYWVWKGGLQRTGTKLRDLVGGVWNSGRRIATDLLLACGLWLLWLGVLRVWQIYSGTSHAASVNVFLPRGVYEAALWIAVSVSAGFCEEVVFRGYLQRQFWALTGSNAAAVLLQAMVFGVAHAYQGTGAALKVGSYGFLFGLLASWRKSLRPGMMAHAWSDIFGGLISKAG